jgi:iron complex transport system substrate-binding protein
MADAAATNDMTSRAAATPTWLQRPRPGSDPGHGRNRRNEQHHRAADQRVRLNTAMRVVSLLPSASEIVAELGLGALLVGRSEECDWPPELTALPVVSAARLDTASIASRDVDAAVRAAVADGRSLYVVDEELLRQLVPDLVLTQDLCAVCAVSSRELCVLDVATLSLDPRSLEEVAASVETVGTALGAPERGQALAGQMRTELAELWAATAGLPLPRVFLAEWVDPPFAPGHWLPELVEVAGGECVLGRAGAHSRQIAWADVREARPDVLVLAPCGYGAERAAREPFPDDVAERAVAVDAGSYFARPAPRLVQGARQLAHILHPDVVADPGLPQVELSSRAA